MTFKTDFIRTLQGEKTETPPIWLMRQAGRYLPEYRALRATADGFMAAVYNPVMAAEMTLQPLRRFEQLDAAITFSDILVIPHALGMNVTFTTGEGPSLTGLPHDPAHLRFDLDVLAPVMAAQRLIRAGLAEDKTLIGFAGSPWTIACYMVSGRNHDDFRDTKVMALSDPERLDIIIDRIVQATIAYACAQIEAGAQAFQLFDSWAGLLAGHRAAFERFIIQPTIRIVEGIRNAYPQVPIIGFPRQCGTFLADYVAATQVDAVGLGWDVDVAWAHQVLPPHVVVQGNLDPMLLLTGGDAMIDAAKHIIKTLAERPFVFNLGHGVVPQTPPEHVAQLVRFVKEKS